MRRTGLLVLVCLLVWASRAQGGSSGGKDRSAPADSLSMKQPTAPIDSSLVAACVAAGDSLFSSEKYREAEGAYQKALKTDKGSLVAQYGLAYSLLKQAQQRGIKGILMHRKALTAARDLAENTPQFAPGLLVYGKCYEWLKGDYDRAIHYYERYLKMRPNDPDGLASLGRACLETRKYRRIEQAILPYSEQHPQDLEILPIVGQYDLVHGRSEEATEAFRRYVEGLDPADKDLYQDIRTVATKQELAEYDTVSSAGRPAFLRQFWAKRDADILTDVNEGLIEHHRRVWYARTYFSAGAKPWDRRGEVYIRYGEPDYRGRSNRPSLAQSPGVQRVKDRLAHALYGADATDEVYVGPVFPVRSMKSDASLDNSTPPLPETADRPGDTPGAPTDPLTNPEIFQEAEADASQSASSTSYAPVTLRSDLSLVPWESWVYVNVVGGIEITFTDEAGNGNYDFAPMPQFEVRNMGDMDLIRRMARVQEFVPSGVYGRAIAARPDDYRVTREGMDLGFYYATADFKGEDGNTRFELSYGIPTKEVASFLGGDTMGVVVERAVALASKDLSTVYRKSDETRLQAFGALKKTRGEFIPDLVTMDVPPGDYRLAVQIKDKLSGKAGVYKQDLKVKPFGNEQLQISDIDLAFAILDSSTIRQFKKKGVYVLPMPSRTYGEGQSAGAYYEVYNLNKDSKGRTRYKVEYIIRSDIDEGFGLLGKTASRFQKLFGGNKPQVSVTYERSGGDRDDVGYVTLDLRRVKPGFNKLQVRVTDLVSGDEADRETVFRYVGKEGKK